MGPCNICWLLWVQTGEDLYFLFQYHGNRLASMGVRGIRRVYMRDVVRASMAAERRKRRWKRQKGVYFRWRGRVYPGHGFISGTGDSRSQNIFG